MKMQHDSFEERIESPEPLYEEVGDFGLQVLKSLETSFLSSAHAETQEVPARPISLGQRKAASLDRMVGSNPVHSLSSSGQSLDTLSQEDSLHVPGRHRSHRSCSPQQELLLQELSTMFCKKPESEEQHTTDWEPHLILQTRQIPRAFCFGTWNCHMYLFETGQQESSIKPIRLLTWSIVPKQSLDFSLWICAIIVLYKLVKSVLACAFVDLLH